MEPVNPRCEDEIDLVEMLRVLVRRRRLILGITAASAVAALVISLMLPVYYKAETRILPPRTRGQALPPVDGAGRGLIALAGGATGVKSQGSCSSGCWSRGRSWTAWSTGST
jgi:hypothetical protein